MTTGDPYDHCAALTRDQWAWEFLRRNPHYQADYRQFIMLWHALEADYGPLDEAADVTLDSTSSDLCIGENDHVYVECWRGAKRGFHKFPLDPARAIPPV